jgi:hypothetical protein
MPQLDEAKIAELKSQNKDLVAIEAGGNHLVFRKPRRLEFDQWFDKRNETSAGLSLAQQCLVFPTAQEFMATLEDRPGILMCSKGIVDSITDLAGMDGGASAKKL